LRWQVIFLFSDRAQNFIVLAYQPERSMIFLFFFPVSPNAGIADGEGFARSMAGMHCWLLSFYF
jgi:hypothetical protein